MVLKLDNRREIDETQNDDKKDNCDNINCGDIGNGNTDITTICY